MTDLRNYTKQTLKHALKICEANIRDGNAVAYHKKVKNEIEYELSHRKE